MELEFSRSIFEQSSSINFHKNPSSGVCVCVYVCVCVCVYRSSRKIRVFLLKFEWNLNFLDRFSNNPQVSTFTKILPVGGGAKLLLHADRYDANTRFTQFLRTPLKTHIPFTVIDTCLDLNWWSIHTKGKRTAILQHMCIMLKTRHLQLLFPSYFIQIPHDLAIKTLTDTSATNSRTNISPIIRLKSRTQNN